MYQYSQKSLNNKFTCHKDLQLIADILITMMNVSIIWGHRNEADQNQAFDKGCSSLRYPDSKHNKTPSMAIDIVPWPNLYKATDKEWNKMANLVKGIATALKHVGLITYNVKWGGNWKKPDKAHFELVAN